MKNINSKANEIDREQQINLLLILATTKSLQEQLYNLKGVYAGETKKRFNRLLQTANSFMYKIDNSWLQENKPVVDELADAVTDMVYLIREGVEKEVKK